jgi:L-2-hydroxyglutarate oxidase LhgO
VVYIAVPVSLIALFVWIYKSSVVTECRWMRELMEPEVALGVLTQADVDALAGSRKERKAYVKAHKGHASHVHAKHVLHAAGDLAQQIAKDGGVETERVQFARAEVARVRNA